ncbi:hypothetical protein EZS27_016749 [termite gut metagenome]|uniref:Uncharacterized protein n=1 Tax=termite gut metagenome TaxID=433724 RepID=A0A5J4RM65_9ZZZZ
MAKVNYFPYIPIFFEIMVSNIHNIHIIIRNNPINLSSR